MEHTPPTSAGAISSLPISGPGVATAFRFADRPVPAAGEMPIGDIRSVTHNYFRTMGIPLLRGRAFTLRDKPGDPKKVVINKAMADFFWPNEDALGKTVLMEWGQPLEAEIIGVVGDVKLAGLDVRPRSTIYWYLPQFPYEFMSFVVRTTGDPIELSAAIRGQIASIDPDQPVAKIRPMEEVLSDSVRTPRFTMLLLGLFATLALLLSAVGIYGVMSYSVLQRTHEIGLRMALGAQQGSVVRMVVGKGMFLALAGVGIGLAIALWLTRLMSSLLFGISATDAMTFAGIPVILLVVAFLACYIPARRGARVDPMVALRYE